MELGTVQLTVAIGEREDHFEEVTMPCGCSADLFMQLAQLGWLMGALALILFPIVARYGDDGQLIASYEGGSVGAIIYYGLFGAVAAWVARIAVHPKVACRCFRSTRLCMQHCTF